MEQKQFILDIGVLLNRNVDRDMNKNIQLLVKENLKLRKPKNKLETFRTKGAWKCVVGGEKTPVTMV